jgi:hypothetical protein
MKLSAYSGGESVQGRAFAPGENLEVFLERMIPRCVETHEIGVLLLRDTLARSLLANTRTT